MISRNELHQGVESPLNHAQVGRTWKNDCFEVKEKLQCVRSGEFAYTTSAKSVRALIPNLVVHVDPTLIL